jgi:hypothetical protein
MTHRSAPIRRGRISAPGEYRKSAAGYRAVCPLRVRAV